MKKVQYLTTTALGGGQNSIVTAGGHTALLPLLSSTQPEVVSLAISALAGLSATLECATALVESGAIANVITIMSSSQVPHLFIFCLKNKLY